MLNLKMNIMKKEKTEEKNSVKKKHLTLLSL